MQPVRRYLLRGVLLACGAGCAAVAAAGVTISPVVLEIDSPRKAIAVTVTNMGDRPITLQTEAMVWQQVNGADHNEPTEDLLVIPPIVEVPAKASQVFRVMLRTRAPSPVERTYRVILEDITKELAAISGQASVAFKFTHNLPVLIAPSGKVVTAMRWKPCRSEAVATASAASSTKPPIARGAEACVRLLNAGNRRVKVETLTLAGDGWQQALTLKAGENVLAGAEREWRVPLAKGQTGPLRSVQVQTARGETLQAEAGGF
jgi:fimbrial chaperone protein